MLKFNNRVAVVTGGAKGIGKEICNKFAENNVNLAIVDVLEEQGKNTVSEMKSKGIKSKFYKCDISKISETDSVIKEIVNDFGKIDILVNNAGITRDNLIMRMSEQEWDSVININLKGTFNCIKSSARPLRKNKWGRIINISSVIGVIGNIGQINYSASKAGIIGITKSTAKELASKGITCNAVAPGFIQTDMTDALPEKVIEKYKTLIPLNKLGSPEDVANSVLFFASEQAGYITGQVLIVDGGMVM
jgi:3-oxoacyl-[acyl-carrier protein] reductase